MITQLISTEWPDAELIHRLSYGLDIPNTVVGEKIWMDGYMPFRREEDFMIIKNRGGAVLAIYAWCPLCGTSFLSNKKHTISIKQGSLQQPLVTVSPSIHNKHCCGWHGWLIDNEFKII